MKQYAVQQFSTGAIPQNRYVGIMSESTHSNPNTSYLDTGAENVFKKKQG